MNIAAKITSLTGPNKVSVGYNIFKLLHPSIQSKFHKIPLQGNDWKYVIKKVILFTRSIQHDLRE